MERVMDQAAFLRDLTRLLGFASEQGFIVTGGELERKPELQKIYVDSGRSADMNSMHLFRCAIDLYFFREDGDGLSLVYDLDGLQAVGEFWEGLDPRNQWGGRWASFKDIPHFERTLGREPEAVSKDGPVPVGSAGASAAFGVKLKKGSSNAQAIALLQTLLGKLGYLSSIDGSFGPGTDAAVRRFQGDKGMLVDGVVGEKTWSALAAEAPDVFREISSRWIGPDDFRQAAEKLGCEEAAVRAVYEVESQGAGFLGLRPKILFEGHVFWRLLKAAGKDPAALRSGNEDILYPAWTSAFYKGGLGEYLRLDRACAIDREIALQSASWGLFQVMGENWKTLGYSGIEDFVAKMELHEREHLFAFCRFVDTKSVRGKTLTQWLCLHDWANFAYGYNGAGYTKNAYDSKLAAAYARHAA